MSASLEALLPSLLKVQDTNLDLSTADYAVRGHRRVRRPVLHTAEATAATSGQDTCPGDYPVPQALNGVEMRQQPRARFYLLLKLDTAKNDLQLVKSLIDEFKVAVIPGCAFGFENGCYLRVSYGMLDEATANIATQRLVEGLGKLC